MTPERWQQIRDVLEKALELPPQQRAVFLNGACLSDPSLRQEVETLLASSEDARTSFLQSPPLRVTITPGTKLGDYEVKSLLGSGGMGEVYRARDSRLGRDVAIKVLPSFGFADSDRLRRFEQEARAATSRVYGKVGHSVIFGAFSLLAGFFVTQSRSSAKRKKARSRSNFLVLERETWWASVFTKVFWN